MTTGADRFAAAAAAVGVSVDVSTFPEGTRTADDAARAVGCDLGAIVKSLVFVVGDQPVLVLTSGANRVDTTRLAACFAATSARQATPEEVLDATGFAIGGTPPFGASLPTLLDRDLLQYETVWAAAGTADSCFPIAPSALREAAAATVADIRQ